MLFRQLIDKESATYSYLLADQDSREAVLIDPVLDQLPAYRQLLAELALTLVAVLDTHIHADHVTASGHLARELDCPNLLGREARADCVRRRYQEGTPIAFGRHKLIPIYTPGHTDDSYCFHLEADGKSMVFTGDTLLIRGTGRTDFQNGDAGAQYDAIQQKLLALKDETLVYPAHDYKGWTVSTIGEERRHNPRLQVPDRDAYIALMAGLKLPHPKMMDLAVPANRHCGLDEAE
ncbi:MBL fold metallo-hydrolase [Gallaecimonas sp. GXIMD4217]|uniref:MBL fold metallo-hydrolase n=1 Tax=Gallaecimonas sp. GXIMD4217 TaxID=3131927 RepID=UPI00311B0C5F